MNEWWSLAVTANYRQEKMLCQAREQRLAKLGPAVLGRRGDSLVEYLLVAAAAAFFWRAA